MPKAKTRRGTAWGNMTRYSMNPLPGSLER